MMNYANPERMIKEPLNTKDAHITFIKYPKGKYQYAGVYVREKLDPDKGWVYKRVAKEIEVNDYLYPGARRIKTDD